MADPSLFVAIPLHNGWIHSQCTAGLLGCMSLFRDRIRIETKIGSLLPRSRDILTAKFLESGYSHLLCVDSDIGWRAEQAQQLLDLQRPYVSGVYAKKTRQLDIPIRLTSKRDGELYGAEYAPGGFQLIERSVIQQMWTHYAPKLGYHASGMSLCNLWRPGTGGEDVAFCERWTRIGGEIWIDPRVVVSHYGEREHVPLVIDGAAVMEGKCLPPREPKAVAAE